MLSDLTAAVNDLRSAWRMRAVAIALASEDVKDLYRRTFLGPIWLLVSYILFVASIAWVVGGVDGTPHYIAFVACGLLIFNFMSEVLGESSNLFQRESAFIKGSTLPISIYVMRLTSKTLMRSVFPLVGAIGFILLSGLTPTLSWGYALLGIVLLVLATPAVATVFATLGVVLPDMHFIVQNVLRLAFFLTPIFWDHAGDPIRKFFFYWNPFTHFINIVRSPIMTGDPAEFSWLIAGVLTLAAWVLAIILLGRYRDRIVFML